MHGLDDVPRLESATDVRLIRHHDEQEALALQQTTGIGGVGIELERR
jgi:hypothetical protein